MEFKLGPMEQNTKVNGKITKHPVKEYSIMLVVINMMAIGNRIKLLDMEFILMLMVQNIKDNGLKIINTVKAFKLGLMRVVIKEHMKKD